MKLNNKNALQNATIRIDSRRIQQTANTERLQDSTESLESFPQESFSSWADSILFEILLAFKASDYF